MDAQDGSAVYAYYSRGEERDRLSVGARGALEFERSAVRPRGS